MRTRHTHDRPSRVHTLRGFALLACLLAPGVASAIIITEIHYHPAGAGELARRGEFIELYNEDPDPRDLTGFALVDGIDFVFTQRTLLPGRSYLVICADEELIQSRYGITNTVGNWPASVSLDNGGERITLIRRGGGVVTSVRYNDRGRWPAGADGTGHSLVLVDEYRGIDTPENWTLSRARGGSPGVANHPGRMVPSAIVINEGMVSNSESRWVELYNCGTQAVDLSGIHVTDDRENLTRATLPEGTVIEPGKWLRLDEADLGLDLALNPPTRARVFVALYDEAAARILDAFTFTGPEPGTDTQGLTEARIPDGSDSLFSAADPTPGAANRVTLPDDIVINEIHYHPIFDDPGREFIEIYNRGATSVDLSGWRFDAGINFVFPPATSLLPNSYLVVARHPAVIREVYDLPESQVLGPAQDEDALEAFGILRNRGERVELIDARGNTVDSVRYHDGGRWPAWPDGGGSSLELIDPFQHNDTGAAWDASDDSDRAEVVEYAYTGTTLSDGESEVHFSLLDDGVAIVDDAFIPGEAISRVEPNQVFVETGDEWEIFKGREEPFEGWSTSVTAGEVGPFVRGDCDGDGAIDSVTDAIFLLLYSFAGSTRPPCLAACDANSDGFAGGDVSDAVYLLAWQLLTGSPPAAPYPECGVSSSGSDLKLGCEITSSCQPLEEGWFRGATPAGYGEGGIATQLLDMRFNYASVYFRREFHITDHTELEHFFLEIDFDDGFVAYLNGAEVGRNGLSGAPPAHDTTASTSRECCGKENLVFDLTSRRDLLRSGTNRIAVQVHNRRIQDDDAYFTLRLYSGRQIDLPDGRNLVPQGDFEIAPGDTWLIQGTHSRTARTTHAPIAGRGSLRLAANGAGDQKINRVETELDADLPAGAIVPLSFKARWVVGSPRIHTLGYNFAMMRTHELSVPEQLGTPGRRNSVTTREEERTGVANLGPVIDQVSQTPVLPAPGEPVVVRARIRDPDGVQSARLFHSINSVYADFTEVPLEGPLEGDFYEGTIPARPFGVVVVFKIEASDAGDRSTRFPRDLGRITHPLVLDPENPLPEEQQWCVYGHRTFSPHKFHQYHVWMHHDNDEILGFRGVHSDEYLDASFAFENRHIYYNVGFRFQGSALGRIKWDKYRVRFADDEDLHGRHHRFNLDSDGLDARDRITQYMVGNNAGDRRVPYTTHIYTELLHNHRAGRTRIHLMPPGKEYLSRWFPDDDQEDLFEMGERSVFSDLGGSNSRINCFFQHPPYDELGSGTNPENYRYFFDHRTNKGRDRYDEIFEWSFLFDPDKTPNDEFDEQIFDVVDVEEFLRVFAIRQNTGDVDTWGGDFGRSAFFYRPLFGGRLLLFPFDSDRSYGHPAGRGLPLSHGDLIVNVFPEVMRFINRPRIRRIYYAILHEMADTHFRSDYLNPFMQLLRDMGATRTEIGEPGGFMDQRASLIREWTASTTFPMQRLEITTNDGSSVSVSDGHVTLEGQAPAEIWTLLVAGLPDEDQPTTEFSRTNMLGWTLVNIPVGEGTGAIELIGLDRVGSVVDTTSIAIDRAE